MFNFLMALMEYDTMNKHSLLGMISACTVALILSNSAQAAPFIIDDFDVNTASSVADATIGGPVSGPSVIDGPNIVMNGTGGWTRTLTAELLTGGNTETEVCPVCAAGHVTMAGPSNGIGTYTYNGPATDLSSLTSLSFDWGADLSGAGVEIVFSDGSNTPIVASWSSLAATGGSAPADLVPQAPMGIAWGAVDRRAITEIQFVVNGVTSMDSIIDNFAGTTDTNAIPAIPAWGLVLTMLGMISVAGRQLRAYAR
jgi:hypothetical protein